jgi:hypothetical protein
MSRKNRKIRKISLPVLDETPERYSHFTPQATKIARSLGMTRRQLADLMASGDEALILQVLEKAFNPCGDCQLCCELLSIDTFNKPTYQKCPKQCTSGCSIHGSHPYECRVYSCFWKMHWIDDDVKFRPDNLGVIFDFAPDPSNPTLRVWQIEPDMVLNNPEVRRITIKLAHESSLPVFAYYKNNQNSIFLIPALAALCTSFELRYPNYPVYDLPGI